MKKIILAILLIVLVYFVGTRVFNNSNINPEVALAQAFNKNSTSSVQIVLASKKVDISLKKDVLYITADFATKADQKTFVTLTAPRILKDGSVYTGSSTPKFQGGLFKKILYGWTVKNTVSTSTLEIAKGKNAYRFVWAIDRNTLPVGSYQMTFDGFMIGNSTTSISLNTPWSKTVTIASSTSTNASTVLDGGNYRLISYNRNTYTGDTTPVIAFQNGLIRARFCNTMEGSYKLNGGTLKANMASTLMACTNNKLDKLERVFSQGINQGLNIKIKGQYLTLSGGNPRSPVELVFEKYTPTAGKIYPCDFIGAIEANATRDCNVPVLTSISTTTVRVGSQVIITGSNFGTSSLVMFTPLSSSLSNPLAVARVATSSVNGITFTVPTSYICENGTTTCGTISTITTGVYKVQIKNTAGISTGSFTLTFTQ